MKLTPTFRLFFLFFLFASSMLFAGDTTVPGNLKSYSTIRSIGFEWNIEGDDNHNAICSVQYRNLGASPATWLPAMPLYRVDFQGANMLAGSVLFLNPGSTYEIQLTLNDPDGGSATRTETVTTRIVPVMPEGGNTYHVVPGSGGGDGSLGNPFKGIEEAENSAQPGDVFLLHAGNYGQTDFKQAGESNNHIVWKAAGDGDPVFGEIWIEADYVWLHGLKIVDQDDGIQASSDHPKECNITHCTLINNHYGIYLKNAGPGWYIAKNIIIGDNDPDQESQTGEGIELWHTDGHTIAYNQISRVADGISYPNCNVDIFGNEIFDVTDDGIEGDYGYANIRIWGNRITNSLKNGISFQPQNGAPWYVLYNQVAILGENVLKMRERTDRALVAHNTFVGQKGLVDFGTGFLMNMEVKNNLWISLQDWYIWKEKHDLDDITNWKTDIDYNGFDWKNHEYAFQWDDVDLVDLAAFQAFTQQEAHGIIVDHVDCFDSLNYTGLVEEYAIEYQILKPTCNAVDAGIPLPNINDGYLGAAPDLGAYELGKPLPVYGLGGEVITNTNPVSEDFFELKQNYPNPFSDQTQIIFTLKSKSTIDLTLYDLLGNKIQTLAAGVFQSGEHQLWWDRNENKNIAPGMYFYVLTIGDQRQARKMIIGK